MLLERVALALEDNMDYPVEHGEMRAAPCRGALLALPPVLLSVLLRLPFSDAYVSDGCR